MQLGTLSLMFSCPCDEEVRYKVKCKLTHVTSNNWLYFRYKTAFLSYIYPKNDRN